MVEKVIRSSRNVVDFAHYKVRHNTAGKAPVTSLRACRHCGAALTEGEREEECSSAFNIEQTRLRPRMFYVD